SNQSHSLLTCLHGAAGSGNSTMNHNYPTDQMEDPCTPLVRPLASRDSGQIVQTILLKSESGEARKIRGEKLPSSYRGGSRETLVLQWNLSVLGESCNFLHGIESQLAVVAQRLHLSQKAIEFPGVLTVCRQRLVGMTVQREDNIGMQPARNQSLGTRAETSL